MNLLQDKIALITGSSRGLGAEIAKVYAANGAKVVINYLSKTDDAKKTLQSIWTLNGTAIAVPTDIRDLDKVTAMVAKIQEQLGGGVDILVNNAYPGGVHGKVESGWADFQNSWSTIVQGGANCINAVLPGMVSKKWGRIINIGSFTLWYARNNAHYTTAKGALLALTRSVAHDYGQFNITANTISPGPIWMDSNSPQPIGNMGLHAALSPLRRLPTSEDIAKAAVFFASNMADGITGANLPVCGGLIMN